MYSVKFPKSFQQSKLKKGFATLKIGEKENFLTAEVRVTRPVSFSQITYELKPEKTESDSIVKFPNHIEHLTATHLNKLVLKISFNDTEILPSSTYVVLQNIAYPSIQYVGHLEPGKKEITIDFAKADTLLSVNGEYKLFIFAESAAFTEKILKW